MDSQNTKVQEVVFNFTGFGAFMTVTKNPTTELIESLQQWIKENQCEFKVGDIRVLNVAAEDCKDYINEIMNELAKKEIENPQTKQILIHLGVHGKAGKIHLEVHGYNKAHFRGADNKNYQPQNEKINKSFPLEHYFKTIMPVEKICTALESNHKVQISDDPGRYVCNYIYYSSLCEGYKRGIPSIFVHVPHFDTISKQEQEAFLKDFMKTTRQCILNECNNC